nr:hypothetical protein [Mycobacterium gordonae]
MGYETVRADVMSQHGRLSSTQPRSRWYAVNIVSGSKACPRPWWQFTAALAAAVTAVAVWILILGHAEVRHEPAAPHPAHVLVSSLGGEFTISSNHAHIENPSVAHHEAFMTAVLPNAPVTTVAALSVVVAVIGAVGLFWRHVILGGRGPPRSIAVVLTGQQLLTRLCSSRR